MRARRNSILFFAAAFAMALSATAVRFPPDWKLAGAETPAARPALNASAWFSGAFAANFEPWLARRFGFRGFAIRLARQLRWWCFREIPSAGTPIDVGLDHWLFEHEYIRHHVKRNPMAREDADAFARRLAALRGALAARGVPLVVCVTPSKPAVYPERLPELLQPSGKYLANVPARETMVAALRSACVPVVDCRERLLAWKEDGVLLFPKNGTHWNAYAAQKCLGEVWALARRDAPALPAVPAVTGHADRPPLLTDGDLAALYNMVAYPYPQATVPYPLLADAPPAARRVRVLGVGDSFCFQLADAMGRTGVVSQYRLLYYNKAEYLFRWDDGQRPPFNDPAKRRRGPVDPDAYDLDALLRDCDLVVVEFNDIYARSCAWGFPR